ncbi:MAG: GNAT family N-acetyltransferase [Thermoproteota archaeon]
MPINEVEIIDVKDEHLEQIIKMIAKFGVPSGADHYKSVEKLKKYMEEGEKRGKVALEGRSGELVGFIFYCLGYVWLLEPFKREFNRSTDIGYISDVIVHPDFQRRGVGSRLVKAAEADLATM